MKRGLFSVIYRLEFLNLKSFFFFWLGRVDEGVCRISFFGGFLKDFLIEMGKGRLVLYGGMGWRIFNIFRRGWFLEIGD